MHSGHAAGKQCQLCPIQLAFFAVFLPPADAFSSFSRSLRMPAR